MPTEYAVEYARTSTDGHGNMLRDWETFLIYDNLYHAVCRAEDESNITTEDYKGQTRVVRVTDEETRILINFPAHERRWEVRDLAHYVEVRFSGQSTIWIGKSPDVEYPVFAPPPPAAPTEADPPQRVEIPGRDDEGRRIAPERSGRNFRRIRLDRGLSSPSEDATIASTNQNELSLLEEAEDRINQAARDHVNQHLPNPSEADYRSARYLMFAGAEALVEWLIEKGAKVDF